MQSAYADLAYKCGMYHQLGKALVPEEYQLLDPAFSEEEVALYRKYTTEGRRLVAELQEKSSGTKRKNVQGEAPTENIPWLMIRESCQQHMERFDGTGYPDGRSDKAISPIAQIVGMAKAFDHYSAEIKSETPFAEACEAIMQESGKAFSPQLCEVFEAAKSKILTAYNKFIHYTMKVPRTVPLVKKAKGRPMGLSYRPIVANAKVTAYEAIPWFAVKDGATEDIAAVAPRLERTGLTEDMSFYLLYEAADTLLRIQNCQLDVKYLLVQMLPAFFGKENHKEDKYYVKNQKIKRRLLRPTGAPYRDRDIVRVHTARLPEDNTGNRRDLGTYPGNSRCNCFRKSRRTVYGRTFRPTKFYYLYIPLSRRSYGTGLYSLCRKRYSRKKLA